ncbi:MAG: flavodoxin family protein, partial [Halobacteriota archaeon]
MKVIAFNGSARKDGNTAILIKQALRELEREGIETELVQLAGGRIQGCIACSEGFETRDQCCVVTDD